MIRLHTPLEGDSTIITFTKRTVLVLLGFLCLLLTYGCGGGGQSVAVGGSGQQSGSLTMRIVFPQPLPSKASAKEARAAAGRYVSGDIPDGSFSLKISLTNPTTGAAIVPPRIVTAPVAPSTGYVVSPVTINFPALPVGPIHVDVSAHPDTQAQETPLGLGSATGTIIPLQTTTLHIPIQLTAAELKIVARIHVNQNTPGQLTPRVLDANGNLLKTPMQFTSSDPTLATVPATGLSGIAVPVTAAGSTTGTIQIKVLEPDSGLLTFVTFFIN